MSNELNFLLQHNSSVSASLLELLVKPMKLDKQFLDQNSENIMQAGGYYPLFYNRLKS